MEREHILEKAFLECEDTDCVDLIAVCRECQDIHDYLVTNATAALAFELQVIDEMGN